MKEVVRVLEDYDNSTDKYIILDKPWFNTPTKLTDGCNILEVMYSNSVNPDEHYYNIRSIGPYKFKWLCGTTLTEINMVTEELNNKYKDIPFSQYGGNVESFIEKGIIEPLYLEEELVPSQFYGLNNYLNCKI